MARSYYDILGVAPDASPQAIKDAFRRAAWTHHPDRSPPGSSDEAFKEVAEAYRVLANDDARRAYDRTGRAPEGASYAPAPPAPPTFRDVVVGAAAAAKRFTARRGESLTLDVRLHVRAVARGTQRVFELPRREPDGRVVARRVAYDLPAGLRDGQVLRWRGAGAPSTDGGVDGDLIVRVQIEPHPVLSIQDADVVATLALSFAELFDGGTVEVPTVDGPRHLAVPPRCAPGTRLPLRGHGVRLADRTGDAVFVVALAFPDRLDDATRAAVASPRDAAFAACLLEATAWKGR